MTVLLASPRLRNSGDLFPTFLLALFLLAPQALGQNSNSLPASTWSGIVISSACNADEAFNEAPDCTKSIPGAKLSLYDDTTRVMYKLEPQDAVTAHLGDAISVEGTLDGDTIKVKAISPMTIGLPVGQKAPTFSAHDQSGKVQTLASLRGANGTVLLFFRSADW
jgi:hypothetical protein